ncbi:MAG: FecR family protein [Gammaproteobacteria bacterium]|nr:FecR family protein [Gammaproteobacteria bacterium]
MNPQVEAEGMSNKDIDDKHEDMLSELFEHASPRPQPSSDARARTFAALHGEWQALSARRRNRQRIMQWSVAATVMIAAVLGFRSMDSGAPTTTIPVAQINRISGDEVFINDRRIDSAAQAAATIRVLPGDTLRAGPDSLVALGWSGGGSLRVAPNTTIRFQSSEAIRLRAGSLYFDSRPFGQAARPDLTFTVDTRFGRISHIGTQFMLRQDATQLSVSVREGEVQLAGPNVDVAVRSGDEKILHANGDFDQRAIDADDPRWRWASDIAPEVEFSRLKIDDILQWAGRETGRTVIYRTSAVRAVAERESAFGLDGQSPEHALQLIPGMTGLSATTGNGRIVVE